MLLFNFICLFYLMVLINSHTISKSIAKNDLIDDTFDSLSDFEYTTEHYLKYDKTRHKHRRAKKDKTTEEKEKTRKEENTTKKGTRTSTLTLVMNEAEKKSSTAIRMWRKFYRKLTKSTTKNAPRKSRRYPKPKVGQCNETDIDIKANHNFEYGNGKKHRSIKTPRKGKKKNQQKNKREVMLTRQDFIEKDTAKNKRSLSPEAMTITPFKVIKNNSIIYKTTPAQDFEQANIMTSPTLSTLLEQSKTLYDDINKTTIYTPLAKLEYPENVKVKAENAYLGTAAIELLLDDIKSRAMQMISDQNPSISEMITNSVTETTFAADPLFNRLYENAGFVTTLVAITGFDAENNKSARQSPEFINNTVQITGGESTHNVLARSIKDDAYTLSCHIEDKLQAELKYLYKKIKSKLLTDLPRELKQTVGHIKATTKKICNDLKQCPSKPKSAKTKQMLIPKAHPMKTTILRQHRDTDNLERKIHKTTQKYTTNHTASTLEDDYVMLSVFEQMLAKTHEDNMMKMLTTTLTTKRKKNEKFRLSKRNLETLADLTLKETIRRQNDGEGIPEESSDYYRSQPESITATTEDYDDATRKQVSSIGDTSFEGLSDKLSYKEFVNGYKHYLNFTKDLYDRKKYSAMVRYQAHRHHSVDDIGKYILDKIPQIPSVRSKRFFDDLDSEDQDISTRSDDSWFKKHFYLFLDSGPPRKFHTSQTVSLKSPDNEQREATSYEPPEEKKVKQHKGMLDLYDEDKNDYDKDRADKSIDLDSLTMTLGEQKASHKYQSHHGITLPEHANIRVTTTVDETTNENMMVLRSFARQNIIGKLFGNKGRRTPKPNTFKISADVDPKDVIDRILEKEFERIKRNLHKENQDSYHNYEQENEYDNRKSTIPMNLFDQAALVTKDHTKRKNCGNVNVNLVPKPTAFVKLKEKTSGKVKKFFNKLKFKKVKKGEASPKKHKRYIHRAPRFNPFKKLRNIFKSSNVESLPAYSDKDLSLITSKVNAFKIIKYDKIPTIEEMKKQIPNITGSSFPEDNIEDNIMSSESMDDHDSKLDKLPTLRKPTLWGAPPAADKIEKDTWEIPKIEKPVANKPLPWDSIEKFDNPSIHRYITKTQTWEKAPEDALHWDKTQPEGTWTDSIEPRFNESTKSISLLADTFMIPKLDIQTDVLMTKEKTKQKNDLSDPTTLLLPNFETVTRKNKVLNKATVSNINLEDIAGEISNFRKSDYHRKGATQIQRNSKSTTIRIPKYKCYTSPNIQRFSLYAPSFDGSNIRSGAPSFRAELKTKLFRSATIVPQRRNEKAFDFVKDVKLQDPFVERRFVDATAKMSSRYTKPFPDYFNDLIRWHNDILNLDVITSAAMPWDDILWKTTLGPNLSRIQEELGLMRAYIDPQSERSFYRKLKTGRKYKPMTKSVRYVNMTSSQPFIKITGYKKVWRSTKPPDGLPDSYMKAADIVKDINELYMRSFKSKPNSRINAIYNQHSKLTTTPQATALKFATRELKPMSIDTSLLSYNDAFDAVTAISKITETAKKKKSRHTATPLLPSTTKTTSVKSKTNLPPKQYFTTPVPLKTSDFERFLKEHNLDVHSVTTPIPETSKYDDNWLVTNGVVSKQTSTSKNKVVDKGKFNKATNSTISLAAKANITTLHKKFTDMKTSKVGFDPEYEMEYLDLLESKLNEDYSFDNDTANRKKREYDDIDRSHYLNNNNSPYSGINKNKLEEMGKTLKKTGEIRKKAASPIEKSGDLKDHLDITIINLDDSSLKYSNTNNDPEPDPTELEAELKMKQKALEEIGFNGQSNKITTSTEQITASNNTKDYLRTMHNELLYDSYDTTNEPTTKIEPYKFGQLVSDKNIDLTPTFPTYTKKYTPLRFEVLQRLPEFSDDNKPKRVLISSNSYKYDVIYHDQDKANKIINISMRTSQPSLMTSRNTYEYPYEKRWNDRSYNTKFTNKPSSTKQMPQDSIVYNLKLMDRTESNQKTTARSKFNLFPRIQKLKLFVENITTKLSTKIDKTKPLRNKASKTTAILRTAEAVDEFNKSDREGKDEMLTDEDYLIHDYNFNELEDVLVVKRTPDQKSVTKKENKSDKTNKSLKAAIGDDIYVEPPNDSADNDPGGKSNPKLKNPFNVNNNATSNVLPKENFHLVFTEPDKENNKETSKANNMRNSSVNWNEKENTNNKESFDSDVKENFNTNNKESVVDKKLKEYLSANTNKCFDTNPKGNLDTNTKESFDLDLDENLNSNTKESFDKNLKEHGNANTQGSVDKNLKEYSNTNESFDTNSKDNVNPITKESLNTNPEENLIAKESFNKNPKENIHLNGKKYVNNKVSNENINLSAKKTGGVNAKTIFNTDQVTETSLALFKPVQTSKEVRNETIILPPSELLTDAKCDKTSVKIYTTAKKHKITETLWNFMKRTRFRKRDCQSQNTYTAKDVAALEVVIDFMKNPSFVEENNRFNILNQMTSVTTLQTNKNSIQVHIAIPYSDYNNKRSAEPLKIRRVFLAKMNTPVDLEYQVKYFEERPIIPVTTTTKNLFSPGMYLLIENGNMSKGNFALKPVRNDVFLREISTSNPMNIDTITQKIINTTNPLNIETIKQKIETTSPKILGRVTLSKDFIAAINKELRDLNDNHDNRLYKTTIHSIKVRKTDDKVENIRKVKRKINWETIKKFFGHDKVCSCHCKPNTTLCRACAASDAVMTELLFEFDNLAKFMNDHCTEIQTYFWMNPSGGRKLRDAVHKIDRALYNYYKRVKGKCQGKACETFSTYMDERTFLVKRNNNYTKDELLQDIETLADNIVNATTFNLTENPTFKEKSHGFVKAVRNCIASKTLTKRSEYNAEKSKVKKVYALDNINVNIICKPDGHSQFKDYPITPPKISTTLEAYDDDEVKKDKQMNRLQLLISKIKKKKLPMTRSYPKEVINKVMASHNKREVKRSQIESPLIADTAGLFWYDYLNKGNRMNYNEPKQNIEINLALQPISKSPLTTAVKILPVTTEERKTTVQNTGFLTFTATPERHDVRRTFQMTESTSKPELFSDNINVLCKLFDSLPGIAEVRDLSNTTTRKKKKNFTSKHKPKTKPKPKCTTKHGKTLKETIKTIITTKKNMSILKNESENKPFNTLAQSNKAKDPNQTFTLSPPDIVKVDKNEIQFTKSTQASILKSLKSASLEILKRIENSNIFKKTTSQILTEGVRHARKASKLHNLTSNIITNNKSEITTSNTTIFIIADYKTARANDIYDLDTANIANYGTSFEVEHDEDSKQNANSLLLSVLKYEKNSLNKEWDRFAKKGLKFEEDMDHLNLTGFQVKPASPKTPNPPQQKPYEPVYKTTEDTLGDYCIFRKFKKLDKPVPAEYRDEKEKKGTMNKLFNRFKFAKNIKAGQLKEAQARYLRDKMSKSEKTFRWFEAPQSTVMVKGCAANSSMPSKDDTSFFRRITDTIKAHLATKNKTSKTSETTETTTTEMSQEIKQVLAETVTATEVYNTMLNDTARRTINKMNPKKRGEACDSTKAFYCICDIHATLDHVLAMHKILPKRHFEKYVKNLKCHKYKTAPKYFVVEPPKRKRQFRRNDGNSYDMEMVSPKNAIRWDWIRNKRSLLADYNNDANADDEETIIKLHGGLDDSNDKYDVSDDVNIVDKGAFSNFDALSDDFFEKYFKDDDDVYRVRKRRRKRTAVDMKGLVMRLKNLPPLRPQANEIYAMSGDNVIIECLPDSKHSRFVDRDISWKTDRNTMLKYDNVLLGGLVVSIKKVEPRNVGYYSCVKGETVHRNVRLTVITIPMFNVVFIPMYSSDQPCSYDDLKALHHLGPLMSQLTCSCSDQKSVAVEEPICMRDEEDGKTKMRATAILTACPHAEPQCGAQCRRDLQCSLALLCASNAPALSSVRVLITKPGENKSLTPSYTKTRKAIVTHTLRKKDLTGHLDYRQLAATMHPGNVDIVVSCPKGHYLMAGQKICLVCPADTYSSEGENACFPCARGSVSVPGADRCKLSLNLRVRRYDWLWSPCGITLLGGVIVACVVCTCVVCTCVVCARVTSRRACAPPVCVGRVESMWAWGRREAAPAAPKNCASTIHTQSPQRPMSPSRVILARLFRGSQTSSRATDSQENKFEQWKEKNIPPPLPPIDFDIN